MAPSTVFAFRYGVFRPLLTLLGAGPRWSKVVVDDGRVRVRMGWAFHADLARAAISNVSPYGGRVMGFGVHGWRGRWLVNGAASGIVEIQLDPPGRGWVFVVPVKLRSLRISVEAPDELIAALGR